MGNYEQLKQAVSSVIKTNGTQAITGQVLQNTLLNMISTLGRGANFAGLATTNTNPGVPDGPVFYFATSPGIYVNFNGITIDKAEGIYILYYEDGTWKKGVVSYNKTTIGFDTLDTLTNRYEDGGVYVVASGTIICGIAIQTTEWHPYCLRQLIVTSALLEGLSETPQAPTMDGSKEAYKVYYRHYDLSTNKWTAWTPFYKEYKTIYFIDAQNLTASSTEDEVKTALGRRTPSDVINLMNRAIFYNQNSSTGVDSPVFVTSDEGNRLCHITIFDETVTHRVILDLLSGLVSSADSFTMVKNGNKRNSEVFNGCDKTHANGEYSHAEGKDTIAGGDFSHAEGYGTKAMSMASYSHVEGLNTSAAGECAHAEGNGCKASANSHAEGYSTVAESNSHAEGYKTNASAYSHAEGHSTKATGTRSHAEGTDTTSSGYGSHAEGGSTTATGKYSHAEGASNKSIGDYSHTEGYINEANGLCAHAEGHKTYASGNYSHASGLGTKALLEAEHVFGTYNELSIQHGADYFWGVPKFIVGNGKDENSRSNAMVVTDKGNQIVKGGIKCGYYLETQNNVGIEEIPIPLDGSVVPNETLFSWLGLSKVEDKDWFTFLQICYVSRLVFSKGSTNQYFADITFWNLDDNSIAREIHFDGKIVHPYDDRIIFVSLIIKQDGIKNVTIDRKMSYIETTSIMPLE